MKSQTESLPTVALAFLGSKLDEVRSGDRWDRWRPTVALGMQDDLLLARLELIVQPAEEELAAAVVRDLKAVSPETEVRLHRLPLRDPWDFEEVFENLLGLGEELAFDPTEEDLLVHITTGTHVCQICLFLLTEARFLPGRLLQTSPPRRRGPVGQYRTIDLDLSRYDALARRFDRESRDALDFLKSGISTRSVAFNQLIDQIERVALRSQHPILLTGPTGAGKSRLARRIFALKEARHQVSGRFVEVNCATLRGDGAMSALFGHVAGAFTGAAKPRAGLLREADGGVLFLDEIGELGVDEQAMLLGAIEERRFFPMGSDREVESDFQLIAGTNRDLARAVVDGQFRVDLLARINLWTFELPALRERQEDIEPNLDYELDGFSKRSGTRVGFNREARQAFLRFATSGRARWSGNFRDLNAAMTRMCTLAPGGRIDRPTVDEEIARLERAWRGAQPEDRILERVLGPVSLESLDRFDRVQLSDVLEVCSRSRSLSEAGRELFAVSRQRRKIANDADRLRKYLARFELDFESIRRALRDA